MAYIARNRRPLCVGMLRIKNEQRWISEVLDSICTVCSRIFVLDDHSTDLTRAECGEFPQVTLFENPHSSLNESRDKNWLYDRILEAYPETVGGVHWPQWLLTIDGDEVLDQRDVPLLRELLDAPPEIVAWKMRIVYLWNKRNLQRVDGVYERFARPSLFRVINPAFRFQSTPWGKDPETGETVNFHCSSIPQEILYQAQWSEVRLKHLGYLNKDDRIRKWQWYRKIDPDNPSEDQYRHIIQGDTEAVRAEDTLMHAGPLRLVEVA